MKNLFPSPNATIRAILDGTVFRKPISVSCIKPSDGPAVQRITVADMKGSGIAQGIHNVDESIRNFARSRFLYALAEKLPVWFAAKDTISKTYDGCFKELFNEITKQSLRKNAPPQVSIIFTPSSMTR